MNEEMNILYFGSVCRFESFEEINSSSSSTPSISTIVFESALIEGLYQLTKKIRIYSFPMFPVFPNNKYIFIKKNVEKLDCGCEVSWIPTINLYFFKQWSRKIYIRKVLKRWIKNNTGKKGVVLIYGINSFASPIILKECNKAGIKCCVIVPDLPRHMYSNTDAKPKFFKLKMKYLQKAIKVQSSFDGYVYLTEKMSEEISMEKPYVVIEGIANTIQNKKRSVKLEKKKSIMYAGGLEEKYGVLNLIEAFEKSNFSDMELWLFGDGSLQETIEYKALINHKIKYFGRVSRDVIIDYEKRSSLLVNVRNNNDEFTKYSFPSKMIEYMLSGTPLLTTKLEGIPNEYYDYVFSIDNTDVENLSNKFNEIFTISEQKMNEFGESAKKFIIENKTPLIQAKRIYKLLKSL
ncbi:MAG: glycosyltransferase [Candidatus Cloacimonetes bacterium]|nr:glycosyltransferase [Candidatus Cloacimonadota bacterium]